MPLTFVEIEKQKSWRIALFFLILLFIYFIITALLASAVNQIFSFFSTRHPESPALFSGSLRNILMLAIFSIIMASVHFYFSAFGAVRFVMHSLGASPPDRNDGIHKRLLNIIEEIHVATGNQRKMDCMVIPSLSMNALAVADLNGKAAVAITEGLLSRLTRPQLEAVMAHEAYHILSGDCMETTVATSIFGMYASALESFHSITQGRIFFSPHFIFAWILLRCSHILHMLISREREYRADAGAIRMTRNPAALAEALHLLSRSWRGIGFIGRGLEMLCVVSPQKNALDESEGWWANLMSTHPPIRKRIKILLRMVRIRISELDAKAGMKINQTAEISGPLYYALDPNQQWQGPFNLTELAFLPWLSPLTWISRVQNQDSGEAEKAWKDPLISAIFSERLNQTKKSLSGFACPKCHQPLSEVFYENTQVYQCDFCKGTLVESNKMPRIIARSEIPCTERIKSLARAVIRENQANLTMQRLKGSNRINIPLTECPKCKRPMLRRFYSFVYLIEIDRCSLCGLTWFDQDELEMLQCMIENRIIESNPSLE